jgi:hypothetical protein
MLSNRARLAPLSALFLQLAQALAKMRVLSVHGSDFRQHSSLGIVETLHNCGQDMHVVAQAGDLVDQSLQCRPEIGQINDRLASLVAHHAISRLNPLYG